MNREELNEMECRAALCAEATIPGWQIRNLIEMAQCLCEVVDMGEEVGMRKGNALYVHYSTFDRWQAALAGRKGATHDTK